MPDLERYITFGASPRASINLILTARALAFIRGRDYALPQDVLDMARDVMRHRLVLSFEALSDDVTADDILTTVLDRPRPGRPARRSSRTSASAPERILQRLDWQVVRRLDGLLQGDYRSLFYGHRRGPRRPARVPARRRRPRTSTGTSRPGWTTPYVRQYPEDREITAWFLLDLSPSVDFGTVDDGPPEADAS